jgi:hypothetical protein
MNVNQGKYGFHTCSYEDFKKIKLLHKHYWLAKLAEGNHKRYYRKDPQNRVIRKQNKVLLATPIPLPAPFFPTVYVTLLKKAVVPFYQQARHPQPSAEHIKPLPISMSQVNSLLAEIEEAYKNK